MGDAIAIHKGTLPWVPNEFQTRMVEEFHHYDMPLVGVVEQSGVDYLFQCVVGEVEPISIWQYTILHPDERAKLEEASQDELLGLAFDFSRRAGVLAIAIEDVGIIGSTGFAPEEPLQLELDVLLREFDAWLQSLSSARDAASNVLREALR
jgi:hypothetical protein